MEGNACYEQMAQAARATAVLHRDTTPYRLVMSRYPQKGIYSMEEGTYHSIPEQERYRHLPVTPTPSADWNGRDMLAEAVREQAKPGSVRGLGVGLRQRFDRQDPSGMGRAEPLLVGDRLFLCFNNPEVREYSLAVRMQ